MSIPSRPNKADELLRKLKNEVGGMLTLHEPELRRIMGNTNVAVMLDRTRAADDYLNEKPHEPDEAARKLYAEHTANGVYPTWNELQESSKDQYRRAASPPHAAAEPERPMDKARREWIRLRAYASGSGGTRIDSGECVELAELLEAAAEPVGDAKDGITTLRAIAARLRYYSGDREQLRNEMADELTKVADALASHSAQPIARDEQDAKRYRKLCDLAWGKPIQDGIYDLQFPSFNYGDPDKHPKAAADRALDALLAAALKSAGKE